MLGNRFPPRGIVVTAIFKQSSQGAILASYVKQAALVTQWNVRRKAGPL